MASTIKKTNNIPKLKKTLKKLDKNQIKVGVFGADKYEYGNDADLVTIARVHEYGANIKPKMAEWLTIPLVKEAKNKSAGDFNDLFFYKVDNDTAFLARKQGKKDHKNIFLLVKEVHIPERSFLRTGFDKNVDKITNKIESMLNDVLDFKVNPDVFMDAIGQEFAGLIQKHMKKLNDPPNSGITTNVKGSSNPLQDTGRLIGSIRHEVE